MYVFRAFVSNLIQDGIECEKFAEAAVDDPSALAPLYDKLVFRVLLCTKCRNRDRGREGEGGVRAGGGDREGLGQEA
jgi:hypothetical protein